MPNSLTAFRNLVAEVSREGVVAKQNVIMTLSRRVPPNSDALTNSGRSYEPILENQPTMAFEGMAATTFEEYDQWIAPNRALDQQFVADDHF